MKICHITSAHPTFDIRIFHKECTSLAEAGFEVSLVCTSTKDNTFYEKGVKIIQVQTDSKSRFYRMVASVNQVYKAAILENADAYHLHDPELIRLIPKFKKLQKIVVFDAHEDLPGQILGKHYIPRMFRITISKFIKLIQRKYIPKANALITAVESNSLKMNLLNRKIVTINNYPINTEFNTFNYKNSKNVCYIGSIAIVRGIKEAIQSVSLANTKLLLAGPFSPQSLLLDLQKMPSWQYVDYYGIADRKTLVKILENSALGIANLHNLASFIDNPATKIFEYMAAGLPVIASNFPLWKTIIEGNNCGICIDPTNVEQIVEAINTILANPDKARIMGENGRKAFLEKYNWEAEKPKLINLYKELASSL
jgi:glycosyltransferase involved in cell wall biosynthesis